MEFNILIAGLYYNVIKWAVNNVRLFVWKKARRTLSLCIVGIETLCKWGGEFHATAVYSPDGMWQTRTRLCAEAPLVWRQARDNGGRDVTISCSAGARKWHCLLNTRPSFHRRTRLAFPAHAHPMSEFPFWKAEAQRNHVFTLWC